MSDKRNAAAHARWPCFSPQWWAAWTFALHRPGRLDDEEIPAALADAAPSWWGAFGEGQRRCGNGPQNRDAAGRRPDWPTMLHAQAAYGPVTTDACRLWGGWCSGACGDDAVAESRERGRRFVVGLTRRGVAP